MRETPPLPLTREIDISSLTRRNPCDSTIILGSFWPYSTHNYESCLVKCFKQACPVHDFQPGIGLLCEIYARRILERLDGERFDWTARALSSSERRPESVRPLALLESILCRELGASSLTGLFFRSEPRPPMRVTDQLSGPGAMLRRIRYAAQDLFIRPTSLGGSTLLIDDIYNTGASMRLYSQALKEFAGVERVTGANLAATRFKAGRDGLGNLRLDTSELNSHPEFEVVWLDSKRVFHARESCQSTVGTPTAKLRFLAESIAAPCPACSPAPRHWELFRGLFR